MLEEIVWARGHSIKTMTCISEKATHLLNLLCPAIFGSLRPAAGDIRVVRFVRHLEGRRLRVWTVGGCVDSLEIRVDDVARWEANCEVAGRWRKERSVVWLMKEVAQVGDTPARMTGNAAVSGGQRQLNGDINCITGLHRIEAKSC